MLGMLGGFLVVVWWLFGAVSASSSAPILISEVQMDGETGASFEFVELRSTSSLPQDLDGWAIEYLSSSGSNWSVKANLAGELQPYSFYLAATEEVGPTDVQLSSGLAKSGGHIRLINKEGIEIDKIGWGTAINPEGEAVDAGPKSASLKRLWNEDGQLVDSDNNGQDFLVSESSSPTASYEIEYECVVEEEEDEEVVLDPIPTPPPIPTFTANLILTELLIDPVSPANDKEDEFVEIYNPNEFAVDLAGYTIETGLEGNYAYEVLSYNLEPKEYFAIFSIDSGLVLSNSGGKARLLSPDGDVISESDEYEKAKAGQSWSLVGNAWVWTSVSPHSANVAPESDSGGVLTKREVGAVLSATNDIASTETAARSIYEEPEQLNSINRKMLVSIGTLALGYMLYEYRSELNRGVEKFRRHLETWRRTWRKS